jgi:tetratricopeptide (TPR) repeat protein
LGITYRYARQFDEAAEALQEQLARNSDSSPAHLHLGYTEIARGNIVEGLRELRIGEELMATRTVYRIGQLALAYTLAGRDEDARRYIDEFEAINEEQPVGDVNWTYIYLALGNDDEAFRRLDSALDTPTATGFTALVELKANPWPLPVLDEPRFQELRQRIGGL